MDLYTKLSNCMEELSNTFSIRMAQYEEDLSVASNDTAPHKTIASLSKEFVEFKGFVWKTMGALKTQMDMLVMGLDRHEMASRAKVLLLHGLSEDENTSLMATVIQTIEHTLQISDITEKDISTCHYLGFNRSKPRPILVRFTSRLRRNQVWQNKSKLKGSGLTISEFLTKPRHDVFMSARKHYGMRQCWTSDGKIVVQVADKTRRKIESAVELRQLIEKFPAAESTHHTSASMKPKATTSGTDKRSRKQAK